MGGWDLLENDHMLPGMDGDYKKIWKVNKYYLSNDMIWLYRNLYKV